MPMRRRIGRSSPTLSGGDVDVVQPDFAFGRVDQAVDAAQQGRFARPAQADDRQKFAVLDLKTDVLEGDRSVIVDFGEIDDSQHRF